MLWAKAKGRLENSGAVGTATGATPAVGPGKGSPRPPEGGN